MRTSCFWSNLSDLAMSLDAEAGTKRLRLQSITAAYCSLNPAERSVMKHALRVLLQELPDMGREIVALDQGKQSSSLALANTA